MVTSSLGSSAYAVINYRRNTLTTKLGKSFSDPIALSFTNVETVRASYKYPQKCEEIMLKVNVVAPGN